MVSLAIGFGLVMLFIIICLYILVVIEEEQIDNYYDVFLNDNGYIKTTLWPDGILCDIENKYRNHYNIKGDKTILYVKAYYKNLELDSFDLKLNRKFDRLEFISDKDIRKYYRKNDHIQDVLNQRNTITIDSNGNIIYDN